MGVIRWEDEQHSFLRAGWLQALSILPTITHSIPNTHTQECSLPSTNYSTWLPLSGRTYRGRGTHIHTESSTLKSQFWGGEVISLTSDPWCHQTQASGSDGVMPNISVTPPNVDLLPLALSKLLTFILNHRHRLFVFLSMYHITETVVIIENGMLREARSLWIIMKTNLWVILSYSALGRVKD